MREVEGRTLDVGRRRPCFTHILLRPPFRSAPKARQLSAQAEASFSEPALGMPPKRGAKPPQCRVKRNPEALAIDDAFRLAVSVDYASGKRLTSLCPGPGFAFSPPPHSARACSLKAHRPLGLRHIAGERTGEVGGVAGHIARQPAVERAGGGSTRGEAGRQMTAINGK